MERTQAVIGAVALAAVFFTMASSSRSQTNKAQSSTSARLAERS